MEESGLIRRVAFLDKHTHYKNVYSPEHHEHLTCLKCSKVTNFYKKSLEDSLGDVAWENDLNPLLINLRKQVIVKIAKKGNR